MPEACADPTVRALLRAWSKKPWLPGQANVLADRLEELGYEASAIWTRISAPNVDSVKDRLRFRRARGRWLCWWRKVLRAQFGDFQEDTQPLRLLADTPEELPF